MLHFKKLTLITLFIGLYCQTSFAGTSIETKILSIQVQDNRTWIEILPAINDATICSNKTYVEISNNLENRKSIISIALTAFVSGKSVTWHTSNNCSNVNKDMIRGIRIVS